MSEGGLNKLFADSQAAALQATDAERKTEAVIEKGRERMGQQGDQKRGNNDPDLHKSNNEQGSWWKDLVTAISNPLQIGSSGFDDKGDQVKKNLERNDTRPPIEEPKPAAENIETPPEGGQAQFTLKGLWSKVSNAVTSVFKAEKTASQDDSLSKQSSSNSAGYPKTEKELPEGGPNKSESQNTSIFSKIRNGLASLWRRGAEQDKEGPSTEPKTSAKEGQGVVVSTKPPTPAIKQKVRFGKDDVRIVEKYLKNKEFEQVETTPTARRRPQSVLMVKQEVPGERSRGG